jgi:hypothetical protein
MFTISIWGRWNSLLTGLQQFRTTRPEPATDVARHAESAPSGAEKMGLRDLCQRMCTHFRREAWRSYVPPTCYLSDHTPAMKPAPSPHIATALTQLPIGDELEAASRMR